MNQDFNNKRVVIFGLGSYCDGSGISAAKFFIRHGAKVLITDKKNRSDLHEAVHKVKDFGKKFKNLPIFVLGKHRQSDFRHANIVVRNPGVPADHPLLQLARQHGAVIHTDVSLFLNRIKKQEFRIKVIGVTGTRGKSTTAALVAEILKKAGKQVFLGGNLGYSPLNFINKITYPSLRVGTGQATKQRSEKTTYVVLELSSWLVESLDEWKINPDYAVITNIYPDHLNTYKTMKDYIKAKAVIFKYQKSGDTLILNKNNRITHQLAKRAKSRVRWFSALNLASLSRLRLDNLPGRHNLENIAASLEVARVLGVNQKQAWRAIKKFKGLWGRLQFVRNLHGVKFYNDTTATTPEATLQALHTLDKTRLQAKSSKLKAKKIILIAGGMDKNLDYKELTREIPKYVKALILFKGTASDKIISGFRFRVSGFRFFKNIDSMIKAVRLASKLAERGDIILLSPAAASFNIFKNEIDRGEQFIKCIN